MKKLLPLLLPLALPLALSACGSDADKAAKPAPVDPFVVAAAPDLARWPPRPISPSG